MVQYLKQTVDVENAVIVSPDAGGAKRWVYIATVIRVVVAIFSPANRQVYSAKHHRLYLFVSARTRLSLLLDLGRQVDCTNSVLQLSLIMLTLVINN